MATTSSLSLWALYDCGDNAAGGPLNAVATRYRCSSPKAPVTAIAGHDDSGRLFFGGNSKNALLIVKALT